MALAWIESQIQDALNSPNTPQNVRDFALLCIAKENLQAILEASTAAPEPQKKASPSSADLTPSIEAVESALSQLAVKTPEELKRAQDARTWTRIMRG